MSTVSFTGWTCVNVQHMTPKYRLFFSVSIHFQSRVVVRELPHLISMFPSMLPLSILNFSKYIYLYPWCFRLMVGKLLPCRQLSLQYTSRNPADRGPEVYLTLLFACCHPVLHIYKSPAMAAVLFQLFVEPGSMSC